MNYDFWERYVGHSIDQFMATTGTSPISVLDSGDNLFKVYTFRESRTTYSTTNAVTYGNAYAQGNNVVVNTTTQGGQVIPNQEHCQWIFWVNQSGTIVNWSTSGNICEPF